MTTPSVKLLAVTAPVAEELETPLDLIEYAGRWDYGPKSVAKMTPSGESKNSIIERWLKSGEESMVEMVDATFLITCSRVVSHELVRHRVASYQQESQRFVSYLDDDPDDLFLIPDEVQGHARDVMASFLRESLDIYNFLVEDQKVPKQLARYVLPNATRTRIIAKTNLREWRHILRLRLHTSAQPEMRQVAALIHGELQAKFGLVLFPYSIADVRSAR